MLLYLCVIAYRRRDGRYLLYSTVPSMRIVAAIALLLLPVYMPVPVYMSLSPPRRPYLFLLFVPLPRADRRRVALDITLLFPCCSYRRRDALPV
jgi:hypothetical protein